MTVFLIILLVILLLCTVLLFTRLSIKLGLDDDFYFSVKILSFTLYDSKKPKAKTKDTKEPEEKKDNIFKKLLKKKGFRQTVTELCRLSQFAIKKCFFVIKHFRFENITLDIKVATDSAADTAIQYGSICTVVYPTATFLNSVANAKFKKIDIRSDFDSQSPELTFDFMVKCRVLWLLIFGIQIFKEYNDFIRRNELYE